MTQNPNQPTPILNTLLKDNRIREDRGNYIGVASDGEEVLLGVTGAEIPLEEYLEEHPTPKYW